MDVLIAILLYLGLLNTQQTYTTDGFTTIAALNSESVLYVSADTTSMRIVTDVYLPQVSFVEIVDRGSGN